MDILEAQASVEVTESGPAYRFPAVPPLTADVVEITSANVHLLAEVTGDQEMHLPCAVVRSKGCRMSASPDGSTGTKVGRPLASVTQMPSGIRTWRRGLRTWADPKRCTKVTAPPRLPRSPAVRPACGTRQRPREGRRLARR